jgi:hypothetical protein
MHPGELRIRWPTVSIRIFDFNFERLTQDPDNDMIDVNHPTCKLANYFRTKISTGFYGTNELKGRYLHKPTEHFYFPFRNFSSRHRISDVIRDSARTRLMSSLRQCQQISIPSSSPPCLNSTLISTVVRILFISHIVVHCRQRMRTDLYGNDETDFNDAGHDEKDAAAPEPEARLAVSTPTEQAPATTAQATPTETTTAKPFTTPVPTTQQIPVATTQPSYPQPATQQIPTYEQPQPAEYRDMAPSRGEGAYQSIPVNERAVRPSEMKDEG